MPGMTIEPAPPEHCSACTGILGNPALDCDCHPDGGHRCHRAPQHQRRTGAAIVVGKHSADHVCDCGFTWTSALGGMDGLEQKWQQAGTQAAARALVAVVAMMRGSALPNAVLMTTLVRDVARELKIELDV